MIKAARAAADRADVAITFIEGRFEDVAQKLGAFDVVTVGRAIHWLDPGPARAALDRVLGSQGKVLMCHASRVRARDKRAARQLVSGREVVKAALGRLSRPRWSVQRLDRERDALATADA